MTANCPLCSAPAEPAFDAPDRFFAIAKGRYEYFRCGACDCVFQWPLPDPSAISEFYPDRYFWSPGEKSWLGMLESAYRDFVLRDHVSFFRRCVPHTGKVLEIGCGTGAFLNRLQGYRYSVGGVERSRHAADLARQFYGLDIFCGTLEQFQPVERYDAVCAFHVLEHIPSPGGFLGRVRDLLGEKGIFVVQVPNWESWQARFFRKRWYGLDPPRHVVNYGARNLKATLRRYGFAVTRERHFSLRDNAAAMASSLLPRLDPVSARSRSRKSAAATVLLELFYFGLVTSFQPLALAEAMAGRGGSIFLCALKTPI